MSGQPIASFKMRVTSDEPVQSGFNVTFPPRRVVLEEPPVGRIELVVFPEGQQFEPDQEYVVVVLKADEAGT